MASVTRLKIPFTLPDWIDTSSAGFEAFIKGDGGPNVDGKIRNVYTGGNTGTIIEFIPGFSPTVAQKTQMKNSLKKLWTEVVEETVTE